MTANVAIRRVPNTALTEPLRQTREKLLEQVERRIREFLSAQRSVWSQVNAKAIAPIDALSDLIDSGGKRIRPAFCLSGYLAAGGDPAEHGAVSAAAALEILHACALIHDDVMDASSQRRGLPTVHAKHSDEHRSRGWQGEPRRFGESVAILAGDLALIYADQIMADASPSVSSVWAELRSELIIGQYMDVVAAAEFSVDPELSRWIALAKSGRYTIHRPLVVGANIAGRPELAPAFKEYGVAIGEAFQLRDDLIDAFGDSNVSGKPAGLDFKQHKMTLLLGMAMQRDPRVRKLFCTEEHDPAELRALLTETGVRGDVEKHIDRLVDQGCRALGDAPLDEAWRQELAAMAHSAAYRDN